MIVGDVAAPAARDEDLGAQLSGTIERQHATGRIRAPGRDGRHQSGGTRAHHHDVVGILHGGEYYKNGGQGAAVEKQEYRIRTLARDGDARGADVVTHDHVVVVNAVRQLAALRIAAAETKLLYARRHVNARTAHAIARFVDHLDLDVAIGRNANFDFGAGCVELGGDGEDGTGDVFERLVRQRFAKRSVSGDVRQVEHCGHALQRVRTRVSHCAQRRARTQRQNYFATVAD